MSLNRRAFIKQVAASAAALGAVRLPPAATAPTLPARADLLPLLIDTDRARDFRAIGHKAITVANCHRLLGVIPLEHNELMLRSLVLALLNHEGELNPADGDLAPDRPWQRNLLLANQAKATEQPKGEGVNAVAVEILQVLREGPDEDASRAMHAGFAHGAREQQLWTAIFLEAGDLMLKQFGIISVHAKTTANALHYACHHVGDPGTRRLILFQAGSFLPLFLDLLGSEHRSLRIDTLEVFDHGGDPGCALEDIFATRGDIRWRFLWESHRTLDQGKSVSARRRA